MSGWAIFLIVIFVLIAAAAVGWIFFTQLRARRLGLPAPPLLPFSRSTNSRTNAYAAPSPAPGGVKDWVTSKFNALRNTRTAGGAYESTGYGGGSGLRTDRRAFGALDPDEAWDARVGNEADYGGPGGYYEEQELGLQDPSHGPYGGGGYGGPPVPMGAVHVGGIEDGRGRSRDRQRVLDERYEEEVHGGAAATHNQQDPFADQAERSDMSLRGVSPRPVVDTHATRSSNHKAQQSLGAASTENSPTERRSMFREDV